MNQWREASGQPAIARTVISGKRGESAHEFSRECFLWPFIQGQQGRRCRAPGGWGIWAEGRTEGGGLEEGALGLLAALAPLGRGVLVGGVEPLLRGRPREVLPAVVALPLHVRGRAQGPPTPAPAPV